MDILQNAILSFYAHNLIEVKNLRKIKHMFEAIDEDGDGLLSFAEFKKVMDDNGRKEEAKEVIKILDYEKNQSVSYEEFIKTLLDRKQLQNETNIRNCFDAIDLGGNGRLLIDEVRQVAFVTADSADNEQFQKDFFRHSQGKHYVGFISCLTMTLWS